MIPADRDLARLTSVQVEALLEGEAPVVALLPVASVEPHGPHLALDTDAVISVAAAARALPLLDERGVVAVVAPTVAYGVTDCAAAFAGAVSVPAEALTAWLRAVVDGLLAAGFAHVCLVNNHLEPGHDAAVRAAVEGVEAASVACPLSRRWGRTLTAEFKSGACHAGRYETSIVLAAAPDRVDSARMESLPEVPISLSEMLSAGIADFAEMGLSRAYAGAPAEASAAEGEATLDRLAEMVSTEVLEGLGRRGDEPAGAG